MAVDAFSEAPPRSRLFGFHTVDPSAPVTATRAKRQVAYTLSLA
jgi:hypothetical protein